MCHLNAPSLQALSSGSGCYQHAKPTSPGEVRSVANAFCTHVAFSLYSTLCFLWKKERQESKTRIKPDEKLEIQEGACPGSS